MLFRSPPPVSDFGRRVEAVSHRLWEHSLRLSLSDSLVLKTSNLKFTLVHDFMLLLLVLLCLRCIVRRQGSNVAGELRNGAFGLGEHVVVHFSTLIG